MMQQLFCMSACQTLSCCPVVLVHTAKLPPNSPPVCMPLLVQGSEADGDGTVQLEPPSPSVPSPRAVAITAARASVAGGGGRDAVLSSVRQGSGHGPRSRVASSGPCSPTAKGARGGSGPGSLNAKGAWGGRVGGTDLPHSSVRTSSAVDRGQGSPKRR